MADGSNLFQYLASFSGAFAVISYGITASWTSPFLPYLTSSSSIIPMTNEEGSWLAISSLIGCPVGAIMASFIADKLGRKSSILCMAPVVFICNIGIAFARNIWYLYAMRFMIGITDGVISTIVPMYIGEISSPKIRGFLSALTTLYSNLGTLTINVIGSFWNIQTCAVISAVIPAVHFLTFIFMPESPYWYLKVGKMERAEQSLKILRGTADVNKQFEIMKAAVQEDTMATKSSYKELFTISSNRKACLIVFLLIFQKRAVAKTPLIFYTKTIFEKSGSSISSTVSTISFFVTELIVTIISAYFIVDRFGKKKLVIISVIGCITALLTIGFYFLLRDFNRSLIEYFQFLPITSLILYNIFCSIGINFAPISYSGELFPTSVKANALTMVEILTVSGEIITAKFFQMTDDYFETLSVPFLSFALISLFCFIFIIKLVPETKGKTLEEIQLYLKGKINKDDGKY